MGQKLCQQHAHLKGSWDREHQRAGLWILVRHWPKRELSPAPTQLQEHFVA